MSGLKYIFEPSSVTIVGASNNPKKFGNIILRNILDSGFQGRVYPVNPKEKEILGLTCVDSIPNLKEAVDFAIVVIPADSVPKAIAECGQKGIRGAVIISGGFRETGEKGARLERSVVEEGKRYGMRIVGPNCQGVNNPHHPICASWPLFTSKGEMAIIAQSGTVAIAFADLSSLDHLGISALVSMGNKADVDEADLIEYFSEHQGTQVISLYIEGVSHPEKFLKALKGCRKPIVVLKSGRTNQGRIAAESHTSSLTGNDEVFDGILKQNRVYRAETFEEFYDFSKAVAYLRRPSGRRLAFVTSSGGAAVLAIDMADKMGMEVPAVPNEIKDILRTFVPQGASVNNPVDLTGDGDAPMFKKVADIIRPYFDTVVYIFGDPIEGSSEIVRSDANELVIFMGGADVERREKALMQKKKIPVFPTPERGIKAYSQLFKFPQFKR
jgi:acetyltransferase